MKKVEKLLVLLLAFTFMVASVAVPNVMAKGRGEDNNGHKVTKERGEDKEDKDQDEELQVEQDEANDADEGQGDTDDGEDIEESEEVKPWQEAKNKLEAEKDAIEEEKDAIEERKDNIEIQYEEAKEKGDMELAQQLLQQLQDTKIEFEQLKQDMKQKKEQMKEVVRNKYTSEELQQLEIVSEQIEANNEDINVLSVDSIIGEGVDLKFDMPPVIKEGRTLIPVRAISEAFGAEVQWDPQEKKVTITKQETEIVLHIDSRTAYVNGNETILDVPSEVLNNRTIVPIRFIAENLGLEISWDDQTETIEVEEGQPQEEAVEEQTQDEQAEDSTNISEDTAEQIDSSVQTESSVQVITEDQNN
ncbi:MAG: stalk domain-containing protein [Clostridia bacterium]